MKPGHIRVFDGLRITTEHMNHLQGSFHSAIEDIREILGLGKVYYGFQVVAETDKAITVQPGLAFDFQKNRIVCEEPKTFEVSFDQDEDAKYVCVKYDQVKKDQVEGEFTRIWDSCSVVMRPNLPELEENLIPIARLIKLKEGEKPFDVINLVPKQKGEGPKEEEEAKKSDGEVEEVIEGSEVPEESETVLEEEGAVEPVEEEQPSAEAAKELEEEGEEHPFLEPEVPESKPEQWRYQIQQGLIRLTSDPEIGKNLGALILEPLRNKSGAGESSNEDEVLVTLAEKEVALDFPLSSLTCQSIISGNLDLNEEVITAETTENEEESVKFTNLQFQSTAQGESTFTDDKVSQFGLSLIQFYQNSGQENMPWLTSEVTEHGIAHLPFRPLLRFRSEDLVTAVDILQHLELLVNANKADGTGFKIICNLLWKGVITEEIIRRIESVRLGFTWETIVAWKGIGENLNHNSS